MAGSYVQLIILMRNFGKFQSGILVLIICQRHIAICFSHGLRFHCLHIVSNTCIFWVNIVPTSGHPWRPRGSQSGREKRRDESFQVRAEEPLGTDSQRTISKNSSGCRLLIGHKKCFVLLCPIGEHISISSFRVFLHDGYCLDHGLSVVAYRWFSCNLGRHK